MNFVHFTAHLSVLILVPKHMYILELNRYQSFLRRDEVNKIKSNIHAAASPNVPGGVHGHTS